MLAILIIIVSIAVAYVLYNKNKKNWSKPILNLKKKNTRRIKNKLAFPSNTNNNTLQRKQAPTYFVTKPSNSVGTNARAVAPVGKPSAGKDIGTGPRPVDVGIGPRPVDVGIGPRPVDVGIGPRPVDRASVGSQTNAAPPPLEQPTSAPDTINVNELPSLDKFIELNNNHVILKNPSEFKNTLQAEIKEKTSSDDNLSPIVGSIITLLLSISEDPKGTINFSQNPPSILTNVPADRIAKATERFDSEGHTEKIEKTLENFATTKNLEGYQSVLQSALKYVEDYINIYIEPGMTVRSIVNIYEPNPSSPSKLPFIINHDTIESDQKKYGRFNKVLQTKERDIYNIDYDAAQIKDGKHMVYAGYGYSGSGKTYTLLDSKNGVLKRLTDKLGYEGSFRNLSFQFVEIYKELDAKYRIVKDGSYRNYFLNNEKIDSEISEQPKSVTFDNVESLNAFIIELNENYRKNWKNYESEDGVRRPRVRSTPNNPQSSRAHLIINVIDANNKTLFTILDMGGSEDVEAIKKLYYESKQIRPAKNQFRNDFVKSLEELEDLEKSQLEQINGGIIQKYSTEKPDIIALISPQKKNDFKKLSTLLDIDYKTNLSDTIDESIRPEPWKDVFEDNSEFTQFLIHDEKVVNFIGAFSVIDSLLDVAFEQGRNPDQKKVFHAQVRVLNRIIEKFNDLEGISLIMVEPIHENMKNKDKTNMKPQDVEFINPVSSYGSYVSKKLKRTRDEFNKAKKRLKILEKKENNMKEDELKKARETYSAAEGKFSKVNKTLTNIKQEYILSRLKNSYVYSQLEKSIQDQIPKFLQHLRATFPGENSISDKYSWFKKDIIRRYHTPLEQQGNYINRSIKEFQKFSLGVSKKQLAENNEFSKVLGMNESSVNEVKIVIFTCIKHEDYKDQTKKDALDQSIKSSLEFAHCVNPLKSVENDYHVCLQVQESVRDLLKNLEGENYSEFLEDSTALLLVILYHIDIFIFSDEIFTNKRRQTTRQRTILKVPCFDTGNKQFIMIKLSEEHFESLTYKGKKTFNYDEDDDDLQKILKELTTLCSDSKQPPGKITQIFDMLEPVYTLGDGTCLLHSYLYLTDQSYNKEQNKGLIAANFRRELHKKLSGDVVLQDTFDTWIKNRFIPDDRFIPDIQRGSGSPQIALSKRSVESLQRLGMFNLVKAIRYKYYEQNRSKFQHDVLLTDRIATLALTIVLLTLTEDAVALGVMFDQIVCTSLSNYNNDRNMLLLPTYLPFI